MRLRRRLGWHRANHAGIKWRGPEMSKKKLPPTSKKKRINKKPLPEMGNKRQERLRRQHARDAEYRAALGIAKEGDLPKQIGNTASAGGGRDRGKVQTKKSAATGGEICGYRRARQADRLDHHKSRWDVVRLTCASACRVRTIGTISGSSRTIDQSRRVMLMHADAVSAWALWATAGIAGWALWFARGQVNEARATRERVAQRNVVVFMDLNPKRWQWFDLVVRNFGQTPAYNIRITLPRLEVKPYYSVCRES